MLLWVFLQIRLQGLALLWAGKERDTGRRAAGVSCAFWQVPILAEDLGVITTDVVALR